MRALLAVATVLITAGSAAHAAQKHPILPESITTTGCVRCHNDHVKGEVVHAATVQCGNCHKVVVEGDATSVVLTRPVKELCSSCHKKAAQQTMHGPYRAGACMQCHDAHHSEQAKLLRARVSTLCSGCHVIDFRGTKIDYAAKIVTLPSKQTLTKSEYDEAPKIELDDGGATGHPVPIHPVSGMNSRGAGQITCLTCHHQHSADLANLVRKTEKGASICTSCHPGMGS